MAGEGDPRWLLTASHTRAATPRLDPKFCVMLSACPQKQKRLLSGYESAKRPSSRGNTDSGSDSGSGPGTAIGRGARADADSAAPRFPGPASAGLCPPPPPPAGLPRGGQGASHIPDGPHASHTPPPGPNAGERWEWKKRRVTRRQGGRRDS